MYMKVKISRKLKEAYEGQHKNFDYEINFILDSLDPESYAACFKMVKAFGLDGEKVDINLSDEVAERIISDLEMESLNQETVELLLWMGAVLPEV